MSNLVVWGDLNTSQGRMLMWCPGCDDVHQISSQWEWDGNRDTPTISPSILVLHPEKRCHSFVRAGRWEFLSDCQHHLAGQTVPMVPVPGHLRPPQDPPTVMGLLDGRAP